MTRFALKALSFEAFVRKLNIVVTAINDAVSNASQSSQTILDRIKPGTANPHPPPKQG